MSGDGDRHAWARPAVEPVADEVFRIPLPLAGDALRAVNVYALRSGRDLALVDAGWDAPDSWRALDDALRRLGGGIAAVRTVTATHLHHDHIGQAARVRASGGAALLLGAGERGSLEQIQRDTDGGRARVGARLRRLGAHDLADQLAAGADDPPERARYEAPDVYLGADSAVVAGGHVLRVVATPGHTQGHVCLWDGAAAALFAGDHVLPHITPSIGLEPVAAARPLADFLRSLERVRALPAATVLPAHGPVFHDLAGRVDALLQHHRVRLARCLEALAESATADPREVAGRLRWTRSERRLQDLDWFNQLLAVGETAAHLDVLVDRAEAESWERSGSVRYRALTALVPTAAPAPPATPEEPGP